LIRQTADSILGVLDTGNYYPIDSIHTLNLNKKLENSGELLISLLAILNSKLFKFLYHWKLDESGTVYPQVKKVNIEWLPIPELSKMASLSLITKRIIEQHLFFEEVSLKFEKYITQSLFAVYKPTSIVNWHLLIFPDFIKELNKAIKAAKGLPLTKKDEFEWMELFEENKKKALELKAQITQTDNEIDQMVYALYELTEDEIKIVEES